MQDTLPVRVRLGAFELDLRAGELRAQDRTVRLQEQPFQILRMLVERAGEVVTRDEIQSKLWPNDTVVEFDHSINAAIKKLRQALNDSAENPRYIETVARRGYRLLIAVEPLGVRDDDRAKGNESRFSQKKNLGRRATDKNVILRKVEPEPQAREVSAPHRPVNGSLIGKKVSHYRVLEVLGGGGMGMVYKAEDLRLGRQVALKFLPEELAWDPMSLRRFEREARTASSLDHPNICTVYEVEEHEGQPFLVMQLLQGETLRDRLARVAASGKTLGLDELLDIAMQMCEGLQAAHDRGIVHRDIKPANIFLTVSQQVKILDFGLAKLAKVNKELGSDALLLETNGDLGEAIQVSRLATPDLTGTRLGVAIGTAGYMSPEQVRGERLDARSDLFSFGLVLYEMATGQRAFTGATATVVHSAILSTSPRPVRDLNPELPVGLEAVVSKALEKNREQRYQSAAELAEELRLVKNGPDPCGCPEDDRSRRWPLWIAGSLIMILAGLAFAWFGWRSVEARPELTERQFTANPLDDPVTGAAISPDGRSVVYHDQTGLYLRAIDSGETRRINLPPKLPNRIWALSWFPGGEKLLAEVASSDGFDIWVISISGEESPHLLYRHAKAPAISPDGRKIAFLGYEPGKVQQEVWLGGIDGETPRILATAGLHEHQFAPTWSPDGRWIAYATTYWKGQGFWTSAIEVRPAEGGPAKTLLAESSLPPSNNLIRGVVMSAVFAEAWSPDWRLVFSVTQSPHSLSETPKYSLWEIRVDPDSGQATGGAERLTGWNNFGVANLTIAGGGKQLAFVKQRNWSDVYLAELGPHGDSVQTPRRFTLDDRGSDQGAWTRDSQAILFDSKQNGKREIFRQGLSENVAEMIVEGGGELHGVDSSPDGSRLLYWESRTGEVTDKPSTPPFFWLMSRATSGGSPQKLLELPVPQLGNAAFYCASNPGASSPCVLSIREGKDLVFYSLDPVRGKGNRLAKIAVSDTGLYIRWALSPDGSHLALIDEDKYGKYVEVSTLLDGSWHDISVQPDVGHLESIVWTADSKGFFMASTSPDSFNLLHVTLDGKAQRLLSNGHRQVFDCPLPSPDGKYLAFQAETYDSNVWMIDNF